ncbi:MAG: hypothetical protein ABIH27_02155 [Candidatus Omnitrophota bacterium]
MPEKIERLIKLVYRRSKPFWPGKASSHPNEEDMACFFEDRLSPEEKERIQEHMLFCDTCMENLALQLRLDPAKEEKVPLGLLKQAKDLIGRELNNTVLEVILKLKDQAIEVLNSTGDILWKGELIPLPILRGRLVKDFKDEVTIFKNFKDKTVEVKIENIQGRAFKLNIRAWDKFKRKIIKDLRITLLKDDLELESYHTDSGGVIFEHVQLGKYKVEIHTPDQLISSIILDIKV